MLRINFIFIGLLFIIFNRLSSLVLLWRCQVLIDNVTPNKGYGQLYNIVSIVGVAILVRDVTSFLLGRGLSVRLQSLMNEFPEDYLFNNNLKNS